jgi:hypothetical protein
MGGLSRQGWVAIGGRLLTVGETATIWAVMDATGADVLAQRALGTLVAHVQRERPAQGPSSDPGRRRGVSGLHRIPPSSTTTVSTDAYADMYIHTRRREIHKLGICGSAPFYTSRGSPPCPPTPPSPPPPILPERRANTNDKTVWSNIQRCFSSLVTIHRGNKWQKKNNRSRETQTFPAWISSKQTDRYLSPALGPCSEVNATMGYAPAIP